MTQSDNSKSDDSANKSSGDAKAKAKANAGEPTGAGPEDDLLTRLGKGELIFEEGDRGSHMYIIESGEVEIVKRAGGRERQVAKLGAGNFFGEMAVLEAMPTAYIQMIETAELV
ncbi:MAG: cyclic nucleotide-binding domain-containing protein, partial [Thermoanaerobaculia bacterium]|nr:cyclic nucleotide-binding domain-containing protein [Thermoanaerobaculia bacterium]